MYANFVKDENEILTPEEKLVCNDIIIDYNKNLQDLNSFLEKNYMIFNHKGKMYVKIKFNNILQLTNVY